MADDKRFIVTYKQGGFIDLEVKILVDKQTGVNYLFVQSGYAGGLTPLLDRNGNPIVSPIPVDSER